MLLQIIGEPSAIRRRTSSEESDFGPENTETEAPESTRNTLSERISLRNRREYLHISGSGSVLKKLAGWKGRFTCRTASFPTPSRVSDSVELCFHASCDTSKDLEKKKMIEQKSENV